MGQFIRICISWAARNPRKQVELFFRSSKAATCYQQEGRVSSSLNRLVRFRRFRLVWDVSSVQSVSNLPRNTSQVLLRALHCRTCPATPIVGNQPFIRSQSDHTLHHLMAPLSETILFLLLYKHVAKWVTAGHYFFFSGRLQTESTWCFVW